MQPRHGSIDIKAPSATILVVDDTAAARDLLTRMLRRLGYSTKSAADGDQGLKAAVEAIPDAIVTDLEMPNVDGQEMVEVIRNSSDALVRQIPIVVCSSRTDEMTIAELRALGADAFIPKPLEFELLANAVERVLL